MNASFMSSTRCGERQFPWYSTHPLLQPAAAGFVDAVADEGEAGGGVGVGVDGEGDAHLLAELDGGVVQVEAVETPSLQTGLLLRSELRVEGTDDLNGRGWVQAVREDDEIAAGEAGTTGNAEGFGAGTNGLRNAVGDRIVARLAEECVDIGAEAGLHRAGICVQAGIHDRFE